MKKVCKFLSIFVMLFSVMAFANGRGDHGSLKVNIVERDGKKSIVSAVDYAQADELTKRMINQIDASIAALDVLGENKDNAGLIAIVSFSKDKNDKFSNSILLAKSDEADAPQELLHGSCKICNVTSAFSCVKQLMRDETLGNEFDIHVSRSNGCATLSW